MPEPESERLYPPPSQLQFLLSLIFADSKIRVLSLIDQRAEDNRMYHHGKGKKRRLLLNPEQDELLYTLCRNYISACLTDYPNASVRSQWLMAENVEVRLYRTGRVRVSIGPTSHSNWTCNICWFRWKPASTPCPAPSTT